MSRIYLFIYFFDLRRCLDYFAKGNALLNDIGKPLLPLNKNAFFQP